jgi:hypothetical protein
MDMTVLIEAGHNLFDNAPNRIDPEEVHIEGHNPFLRHGSLHPLGQGCLAIAPGGVENDVGLVEYVRGKLFQLLLTVAKRFIDCQLAERKRVPHGCFHLYYSIITTL